MTEYVKTLTSDEFLLNPRNEPVLDYRPGSREKQLLDQAIDKIYTNLVDVPIVVGAEEIRTKNQQKQCMPSEHSHCIANYYYADKDIINNAINNSLAAREAWARKPLKERAQVLLTAADLVATKYRAEINAATMLGQGKTIIQAEIDSACELIDFLRFNVHFALEAEKYKPLDASGVHNRVVYRGLEGFVAAVSPFNFTAIGGNLCAAPALMGNVVVWKPSDTALLASYLVFKILREAGMPAGVVNFVPADGPIFGDTVTSNCNLAGINFTGSVPTFRRLWKQVGENIEKFKTFPRLVGECGGKNFHFIHSSADVDLVVPCTLRAAFEYQGQKCSACSRLYVPKSLWPQIKDKLVQLRDKITVGQPTDNKSFMTAVIDKRAFDRIVGYIEHAKTSPNLKIIAGGTYDSRVGYFIQPTIIECSDPTDKIFTEEIFGPVVSVYQYPDDKVDEALASVKSTTAYALTGAVFAQDEAFLRKASEVLREAIGNFYINDRCTGSIVGQQPFGGARLSGTNDKAGGPHYVLKWSSPLTIKEATSASKDWRYPSME